MRTARSLTVSHRKTTHAPPPGATTHTPQSNHTRPPWEQPRTPPGSNHACPLSNHACPPGATTHAPPPCGQTDTCKNQTSFAGGNKTRVCATIRARLHQASASTLWLLYNDPSDTVLIVNSGDAWKWVAIQFWSVIAKLSLGVNGHLPLGASSSVRRWLWTAQMALGSWHWRTCEWRPFPPVNCTSSGEPRSRFGFVPQDHL